MTNLRTPMEPPKALPVLTLTHARGLRRAGDKRLKEMIKRVEHSDGGPHRFGPRVRAEDARLRRVLGDRVRMAFAGKRLARWELMLPNDDGTYRLAYRTFTRTGHLIHADLHESRLIATPHFVERAIQSRARGVGTVVEVMSEVWAALAASPAIGPHADHVCPLTPRMLSVAISSGLVRAEVLSTGEVVLRTVIAEPCLDYENRLEWLGLRHETPPVSFWEPSTDRIDEDTEPVANGCELAAPLEDHIMISNGTQTVSEDQLNG